MIYIDTSCLVKLLCEEPESDAVREAVEVEEQIIISSLTELEAEVELKGMEMGGELRVGQWRHFQARLAAMKNLDPFVFRFLPASVFQTALRQHRHARSVYCRSLDRLHLAAMEEMNVSRLMTLDRKQAEVATALGFKVLQPGRK